MDRRDLKIGDYVHHKSPDGTESTIIQIAELRNQCVRTPLSITSMLYYENLEPIPLTDELLERIGGKNVKIMNAKYIVFCDSNNGVQLTKYRYGYILTSSSLGNIAVHKPIQYIHQLQHELFDAGVEFKIKLQ